MSKLRLACLMLFAAALTGCAQHSPVATQSSDALPEPTEPAAPASPHVAHRQSSLNAPASVSIGSLPVHSLSYGEPRIYPGYYDSYSAPYSYTSNYGYGYGYGYDHGYRSHCYSRYNNSDCRRGYVTVTPLQKITVRR